MQASQYPSAEIVIGDKWIGARERETIDVVNPVNGRRIGLVPCVTPADLAEASTVAHSAFG
jgi:acyl-CoA reductase-like NAD-dependent aldehyde dehydrogenase